MSENMTNAEQLTDAILREIAGSVRDASSISAIQSNLEAVDAEITQRIGQLMRDGEDEQASRLRDSASYLTDAIEVLGNLYVQMEGRGF